jgi:hypothetical protein
MFNLIVLFSATWVSVSLAMAVVMILCAAFMGITFTQSGFDKLINYKSNREYFESQFSKSVFAKMTGMLLPVILLLEIVSGLACLAGIIIFIIDPHNGAVIVTGLISSALTLLLLLFGQRMAKDYAGAASIPGYFLVALVGVVACGFAIR